jgi:hypothetical protein
MSIGAFRPGSLAAWTTRSFAPFALGFDEVVDCSLRGEEIWFHGALSKI